MVIAQTRTGTKRGPATRSHESSLVPLPLSSLPIRAVQTFVHDSTSPKSMQDKTHAIRRILGVSSEGYDQARDTVGESEEKMRSLNFIVCQLDLESSLLKTQEAAELLVS